FGLGRLAGRGMAAGGVAALGLVSARAVWASVLARPVLAGIGAGLRRAGLRRRPHGVGVWATGFALGASPLLLARLVGASGASPVTALRPRWLWADGAGALARAAQGLFGLQVPLVVDGPARAALPLAAVVTLGLGLVVMLAVASRSP